MQQVLPRRADGHLFGEGASALYKIRFFTSVDKQTTYIFRPTQILIYFNTATCFGLLIGPSPGSQIKIFKKDKYA
jgi:hypothetical protein